jgi:YaiO family outer membrane protein
MRWARVIATLLCGGTCHGSWALAQARPFLDAAAEWSPVTLGSTRTTWQTAALSAGLVSEGQFGVSAAIERHQRGTSMDWTASGSGYRRAGDWTFSGMAGFSARPDFYYRRSLEAEIARRIIGGLVLHAGYRSLVFPTATVRMIQPGASWYFARGWVQARLFFLRNNATREDGTTLLVRGSADVTPRLRIEAGTATGPRIFDVSALPAAKARAWVVFAGASLRIAPQWTVRATIGGAHEDPSFSQQTAGIGMRWAPR